MKLKIPFMGLRLRSSDVTGHIHEKRTPPQMILMLSSNLKDKIKNYSFFKKPL